MRDDKPKPGSADWITIAISPALIMAMIVSLVFFLMAILYRGEFAHRLHVIFFFFVFGIVLVARIALESGFEERAPLYGSVLAALVWLGMGSLVKYPPEMAAPSWLINACLVALAWWLSYRLVYNCTYIDEKANNTGTGVLEAAGLDAPSTETSVPPAQNGVAADEPSPKTTKRSNKRKTGPTWWDRYQRYRADGQKQQPPGLWVVYFGLAALPIFGLGQALIEVGDEERRAQTFFYMSVYIVSSLGLLVTTAFLGLRRYLRQRGLRMPKMVTTAWIIIGAVLVAALSGIGAALPRPQSENSPLDWVRATSEKRKASRFALTREEPGSDERERGAEKQDPAGKPARGKSSDAKGNGDKGKAKASGDSTKKSPQEAPKKSDSKNQEAQAKQAPQHDATAPPAAPKIPGIPPALKWLVFGILALIVLFVLARSGLRYLANFTDWARRLWDSLRRFWEDLTVWRSGRGDGTDAETMVAPPPFRAFANPFHGGRSSSMKPAELVRYSFEALEAWAGERAHGRESDETPIEFTDRLTDEVGSLDEETQQLGNLYACVLYAEGALPSDWRGTLERFWERLGGSAR